MDISAITDYLFVGAEPRAEDVKEILGHKVELVISMLERRPAKALAEPPLTSLWVRCYDTFLTPIRTKDLEQGVQRAQQVIEGGGRVLVHCHGGRHRSIIMAAAILISQGYTADQAIALLQERRPIADPRMWYVRWQIHRFERRWREAQTSGEK